MAFKYLFGRTLKGSIDDADRFAIKDSTVVSGNPDRNVLFSTVKTWILAITEIADNILYRNRVKTKVLWTGPLSVVSTPTSLDGGEKFSDWDLIEVDMSLNSDVDSFFGSPNVALSSLDTIRAWGNSGHITYQKLTDTTFQINSKTVVAGNIQRIIGISL